MNNTAQKSTEIRLSIPGSIGKAVHVHPLNLENDRQEEIYEEMDQVIDPSMPARYIHEAHYRGLVESLCYYQYNCRGCMITAYLSLLYTENVQPITCFAQDLCQKLRKDE